MRNADGMALNVQWGGEHLDNVRSEHATAHSSFRIPHSLDRAGCPTQAHQTRDAHFWVRPQAALRVRVRVRVGGSLDYG